MVRAHHLSDKSAGFSSKLASKLEGPYKVVKVLSPVVFDLENVETGQQLFKCHANDMFTFHCRENASGRSQHPAKESPPGRCQDPSPLPAQRASF